MANGKIKADTLEHSTAGSLDTKFVVNGSAKVWVFATSDVITDSLNTSSSTDVATGEYTFTFTSATATTNVAMTGTVLQNNNYIIGRKSNTTSSYNIRIKNTGNNGQDANTGSSVHGDLA